MKLDHEEIHVWLAFDRDFAPGLVEELGALLEPGERDRAARQRAPDLPRQQVVTRALQRLALSRYVPGVAPDAWRFVASRHGKPAVAAAFGHHGIHFNIAHTAGMVAMAVARHASLGIDVESLDRRAPLAVAPRYFTPGEAAALAALPGDDQRRRFFALWTLKESWLKATGAGLAGGLGEVSFEFENATHACSVALADGDEAAAWRFWQAAPSAGHLLAVAARCGPGARVRAFCWQPAPRLDGAELPAPRPVIR